MTYQPYEIIGAGRPSRFLLTCDHATNTVPPAVNGGDLGLPAADMERHIAYDIGAAGVTRALAELLQAPAILSNFSRLVIDPNRGEDDPTLLMRLYDGTVIPANRDADTAELERRLNAYYRPYHAALEGLAEARGEPVIVSIHSYTPQLKNRPPRPWHIGILSAYDRRFTDPLMARLAEDPELCVGDNEPYGGHLAGDAIERHALRHGRINALIELRHDLIATPEGQAEWAARLAPVLTDVLEETGL